MVPAPALSLPLIDQDSGILRRVTDGAWPLLQEFCYSGLARGLGNIHGGLPLLVSEIAVGAGIQQNFGDVCMTLCAGDHQCRIALTVADVGARTSLQQAAHHICESGLGGQYESGIAGSCAAIDVAAPPNQQPGRFLLAIFERTHQWRTPLLVGDTGVGMPSEQQPDCTSITAVGSMPNGRSALLVLSVDECCVVGVDQGDGLR